MKLDSVRCVLAAALAVSPMSAFALTASPGGNVTMSGTGYFTVRNSITNTLEYEAPCAMSIHAYLDPANAHLTINDIDVARPCGYINPGQPVAVGFNTPWTSAVVLSPSTPAFARSEMTGTTMSFGQYDGDGPRWGALCTVSTPGWFIDWHSNLAQPKVARSISSGGNVKIATSTNGRECYVSFNLPVSPYQTIQ